ncbi:Tn7-like element transposition protein TnsE [Pectinatus brassicae]|uniref:TnsE C-terminal domain-containing protein n=1 Tax=Pectinatus brassicae TaxID=862415 RepID=A0A840URX1_9FIRM|nr:Tn7-like element transposition protein TnsE [Pectinatus brassicae]MBB5335733.1 hypothetical protein [Pectinatus brassicae]
MTKSIIRLNKWPFEKGEKAKLIKISKPYHAKGRWFVDALFLSIEHNYPKTLRRSFGDLHLLIVAAVYIDGVRQDMSKWVEADISIVEDVLHRKPIEPYLLKNGRDHRFDCYTFGISINYKYYIISLFEIMRAILAPDVFWLNQITQFDSIDTRILHALKNDVLELNFSTDVPVNYVKQNAAIKHVAWVLSNPEIYSMLNLLYKNIKENKGILFEFLFNDLTLTIRFEERNGRRYIREIIACKQKRLKCNAIQVTHPRLATYEEVEDRKNRELNKSKRKIVTLSSDYTKDLIANMTASNNFLDIEDDKDILSEYSTFTEINRIKINKECVTSKSTKCNIISDTNQRTTGDFGGLETIPQLEFAHIMQDNLDDDFADIQAVLQLMGKRSKTDSITQYIGVLNNHWRYRSICTLDDGVTPRKYLIGKIKTQNNTNAIIIEIQRQHLSISTLMCISKQLLNWDKICHNIIKKFIINSGTWPQLEKINYLVCYRLKHTNITIEKKEERLFNKLF